MKRFLMIGVVCLAVWSAVGSAEAVDGPLRRATRGSLPFPVSPSTYYGQRLYTGEHRYDPPWEQPDLYPKWYAGFHSRHIEYYGYPHGDIGLRGFAW